MVTQRNVIRERFAANVAGYLHSHQFTIPAPPQSGQQPVWSQCLQPMPAPLHFLHSPDPRHPPHAFANRTKILANKILMLYTALSRFVISLV